MCQDLSDEEIAAVFAEPTHLAGPHIVVASELSSAAGEAAALAPKQSTAGAHEAAPIRALGSKKRDHSELEAAPQSAEEELQTEVRRVPLHKWRNGGSPCSLTRTRPALPQQMMIR